MSLRQGSRIRGAEDSSDNNETLRQAQGDRREGFEPKATDFHQSRFIRRYLMEMVT